MSYKPITQILKEVAALAKSFLKKDEVPKLDNGAKQNFRAFL